MSQPKTTKAGFKAPPLDTLKGRGPPITKKRPIFFLIGMRRRSPLYPIVYMEWQTTVKRLKKGIYAAAVSANCSYKFLSPVLECS